jgi:enoyl-[acyl-carrier protein] reductase I
VTIATTLTRSRRTNQCRLSALGILHYTRSLFMTDFSGKHGLIVGVANKRSIAWAIAQVTARRGARLALTYQGRFEDHVRELSEGLQPSPLVLPCDVTSDDEIAAVFSRVEQEFGGLDFVVHGVAFAPREELEAPFLNISRNGFRTTLDISAYSLIALARGATPLMEKRGGGSVLTLSYLGSERVVPGYHVMGVAKAALEATVRYLAADVGQKNIRVNAVSAGPIKTLAAAGIKGFSNILHIYPERAPLRRNVETAEVAEAAAFLLSDAGKGVTGDVIYVDAGYHVTGV